MRDVSLIKGEGLLLKIAQVEYLELVADFKGHEFPPVVLTPITEALVEDEGSHLTFFLFF